MYLNRYDDAIRALERWQPVGDRSDAWSSYARFNIGVALVRKERVEDAAKLLDGVGQIEAPTEELAALRDKANLALGYAWLKAGKPDDAKAALQRVRLAGSAIQQGVARRRLGGLGTSSIHQGPGALARVARPQSARRCGPGILSRGPIRVRATRRARSGRRAIHTGCRQIRRGSSAHRSVDRSHSQRHAARRHRRQRQGRSRWLVLAATESP